MNMEEQKMTVIGEVDPVVVVYRLRKLCPAELVSVGPAKEEKKKAKVEPKKDKEKKEPGKEKPKKDEEKEPEEEEPKKDKNKNDVLELIEAYKAYNPYTSVSTPRVVKGSIEEDQYQDQNSCVIC
jgi:hypothetical protein